LFFFFSSLFLEPHLSFDAEFPLFCPADTVFKLAAPPQPIDLFFPFSFRNSPFFLGKAARSAVRGQTLPFTCGSTSRSRQVPPGSGQSFYLKTPLTETLLPWQKFLPGKPRLLFGHPVPFPHKHVPPETLFIALRQGVFLNPRCLAFFFLIFFFFYPSKKRSSELFLSFDPQKNFLNRKVFPLKEKIGSRRARISSRKCSFLPFMG